MSDNAIMHLTKRKRMELDLGKESSEDIKRSHALWFDDGSVVLQAQKTQFRVHRSVLCIHSKVFQDMFTVPQPDAPAVIEGIPLVHVVDEAVDWENVLGIIYFGLKIHGDYSVGSLISMMRLGHKYQFDDIKSTAITRLVKEFPGTFADWTNESISDPHSSIKKCDNYFSKGYEIDLINIALEVQCQAILPVLFYVFLRDRQLSEIFDGTIRKDRTVARLSPDTQRTLILGKANILRSIWAHTLKWMTATSPISLECDDCFPYRRRLMEELVPEIHDNISIALQDTDPHFFSELCEECLEEAEAEMTEGRKRLWNELPSYFDLPPWDVLAKFDN